MHSAFLVSIPKDSDGTDGEQVTYEKAQLEMMNQVDKKKKQLEEEAEKEREA